jgi:aspartate racemase
MARSSMKTLGIIGGIGPESTIQYYRMIQALYRQRRADGAYPSIIINSIDVQRVLALAEAGQLEDLVSYLSAELDRLVAAGADFGLLAANTPHVVFDQLAHSTPMPLLSIVEVTCRAAKAKDISRVALLGTRSTMQGSFYPKVFGRAGISIVVPAQEEQDIIHTKYVGELVRGVVSLTTRNALYAIIERLRRDEGIQGVVLGGTELSLLLQEGSLPGLQLLDTTKIHAEAAVEELLSAA